MDPEITRLLEESSSASWYKLKLENFNKIFEKATRELLASSNDDSEKLIMLWSFVIKSFQHFHHPSIRPVLSRYVFDGIALMLHEGRMDLELSEKMPPQIAQSIKATIDKLSDLLKKNETLKWQQSFFSKLIKKVQQKDDNNDDIHQCKHQNFLNTLLTIMLNQRISRRMLIILLLDHQYQSKEIIHLLKMPFDNYMMEELETDEYKARLYEQIHNMQKKILEINPNLALASFSKIAKDIREILSRENDNVKLKEIASALAMNYIDKDKFKRQMEIEYTIYEPRDRQDIPLYPTEESMKNKQDKTYPNEYLTWSLMFDSIIDNYRIDCMEAIRIDIEDAIYKCQPVYTEQLKRVEFDGWSRMALPIHSCMLKKVEGQDLLKQQRSEKVIMELVWELSTYSQAIRHEWDSLKAGDVLFLVRFNIKKVDNKEINTTIFDQYGVDIIRGVKLIELSKKKKNLSNLDFCIAQVALDPVQYELDLQSGISMDGFQLVLRRMAKENNFSLILHSLKSCPIPSSNIINEEMDGIILGYEANNELVSINISSDYIEKSANLVDSLLLSSSSSSSRSTTEGDGSGGGRTLVIARSNSSLDELLSFIKGPTNRLIRLGFAEKKYRNNAGRLDYHIERKKKLLDNVEKLMDSLEIVNEFARSCEASHFFHLKHIKPRWEAYLEMIEKFEIIKDGAGIDVKELIDMFPFKKYFNDDKEEEKKEKEQEQEQNSHREFTTLTDVKEAFKEIDELFKDLYDLWPLELLPMNEQIQSYLACKYSKVIMMTATLFAIRYSDFKELEYDNYVIVDAHTIGEELSILPLTLIKKEKSIKLHMFGSESTLPTLMNRLRIINNNKVNNDLMTVKDVEDESKEKGLLLPSSSLTLTHHDSTIAGLKHSSQFIHVGPYEERGETQPSSNIIQNLGEAEYIISLYQHLRFHDHQPKTITILTPYRGQLALIKDIWDKRCTGWTRWFDKPKMATFDEFSGRKADIILISLVRTRHKGFITESKIIDAIKSAKRAVYIFGDQTIWTKVSPTIKQLIDQYGSKLVLLLLPANNDGSNKLVDDSTAFKEHVIEDLLEMGQLIYEICLKRKDELKLSKLNP